MKQALLLFCLFSFTISNGQIEVLKANDFLPNTTPCKAGGTITTNPSSTESGKWEMNLLLDTVNHTYIMGEVLFENKIPEQVGGNNTSISDLISINSSNFVLKANALRASDSNFDGCNKPSGTQYDRLRFSINYQGTLQNNGDNLTFTITTTDHGAASPITQDILVTLTQPQTGTIDKLEKYDFVFGPNPTKDLIYLSASKSIGNVEIFNLVGQKTLSTNLRDTKGTLDISNLTSGVYIMNVAIDKNIGTYKLIKQ